MTLSAAVGGLALLVSTQGPSGEVLDLPSAVKTALQHNPEVAQARAARDAERAGAAGARAWPEPSLSYQAWQQPLATPFDPTATNMHMLGIRQTLPFPGQLGRAGRAAEAGAAARGADFLAARLRLEAQVAHALNGYWLIQHELEAHARHLELGQQTVAAVRARYVSGQARQADLLRAETELHRQHASIAGLRENLRGTMALLNALLGRPPDSALPAASEPEAELPSGALERPEVAAARLRTVEAQESAALADKARRLPEVMVGFDYMLMPGMPDAYSVMLQVPMPWLSGRRTADAERARRQVEELHFAKASAENAARYEVAEAQAGVAAARAQLVVTEEKLVPGAERALEATRASYVAGQADLLALLDAESALLDARLSQVRQRAAQGDAIADLRRALGLSLISEKQP
ncbi:TolC family protein [Myxococcus sp. MISCRS1]|nr:MULTISPECIES: TolC family protein [Myxococcus]MCY0998388.1 TolC family protein [Myxococcus sp. MISCRS1]